MICYICHKLLIGRYFIDVWGNKMCESHLNKNVVHCVSCSAFTQREYTLEDGRVLCKTCYGAAIKPGDSIENVKNFVINCLFNIGFSDLRLEDITYEIVTAQKMAEIRKKPVNTQIKGFTYSNITITTFGKSTSKKFVHNIYILTHLANVDFAGTLAHEMLHAWLTQNEIKMSQKLEEGFCNMGNYLMYSSMSGELAKMLLKSLRENPDPIYGDGFREMFEHFKRLGWKELIKNVKEKPETFLNPCVSGNIKNKSPSIIAKPISGYDAELAKILSKF